MSDEIEIKKDQALPVLVKKEVVPKKKVVKKKPIVNNTIVITRKVKKNIDLYLKKIKSIVNHIQGVQDNCLLLGEKLIEAGEIELGKQLIANGFIHDNSKFYGIEFEYMAVNPTTEQDKKLKLKMAVHHHTSTNKHHPEAWSAGITDMPDIFLAEMACDIKSRSEEFGTNLREWIDVVATKKWSFTKDSPTYSKLMKYVNLLCNVPFEDLSKMKV
jgi:hypothetical protein